MVRGRGRRPALRRVVPQAANMWEAIESNRRRSRVLIALLGVILVTLGALIGATVGTAIGEAEDFVRSGYDREYQSRPYAAPRASPEAPRGVLATLVNDPAARGGAVCGVVVAGGLWLLLWGLAVTRGESVLLSAANARRIEKADAPQLWNVVEEMSIAAGLPQMPAVYIIDDAALNAFAVGYRPDRAAVAVTSGLLKRLDRDELQGVVAHEIGHIRNADVRFMTLAAVMVGTIVLLAEVFLRGLRHVGRGRRSSRGGGQAAAILLLVTIVFALLAPLAAQLLFFACSRRREYLADASAARFTRYPAALASALEKIERHARPAETHAMLAPLFIVNPLAGGLTGLWSTHPPTRERIRILRSMGDAGFAAYEQAYRQTTGRRGCIGARTLAAADTASLREPGAPPAPAEAAQRARDVGALLDRIGDFVVIGCVCGVRLKLPPGDARAEVSCPRCGRGHVVPVAETLGAVAATAARRRKAPPAMRYRRRGGGWESFKCACGNPLQIGPTFSAPALRCSKCGGRIEVVPPDAT